MTSRLYSFVGGATGPWRTISANAVIGAPLVSPARLDIVDGDISARNDAQWVLRGVTSNERYVARAEKDLLAANKPVLGRASANCAALIPIRKSEAWWALAQDERRYIFEETSKHIAIGLRYVPAIARRLHHCRDLGSNEPFDFLTWFEYAAADSPAFEELVAALRSSEEWRYVDREIDLRFARGV